jgi:hypothetical protein
MMKTITHVMAGEKKVRGSVAYKFFSVAYKFFNER